MTEYIPTKKFYNIAIIVDDKASAKAYSVDESVFGLYFYKTLDELIGETEIHFDIIGILGGDSETEIVELCRKIKVEAQFELVPILAGDTEGRRLDTVTLLEAGCEDVVDARMPRRELELRLEKIIFQVRAEAELKRSADEARKVALNVMTESSTLGLTVQYLIDSSFCDNVDELGMQLFETLKHYGLRYSLQLRSLFGVKNMEETGIERDLEARLLTEFQHKGRFVVLGKRCIVNYGQVSLLIKNMPRNDAEQCTNIKDSILPLVQGTESRLRAIDAQRALEVERNLMAKVVGRLRTTMKEFDDGYQDIMTSSAEISEKMASKIDESILFLDLTERQEETIEAIVHENVRDINVEFSKGVEMNRCFGDFVDQMTSAFSDDDVVPDINKLLELSAKL
ncbi:MAG: hypothetical protein KUG76_01170 [Gammaproteobacteria bacterium]|nr:hypothetical protein [Gammaproteobacteria bacterium]